MKPLYAIAFLALFPLAVTRLSAKPEPAEFDAVERIIALGDVHGDFPQLIAVLKSARLINDKLGWTGGKAHLVQMGDLPDRGPDTREIIAFFRKLEKQAARAGGRVHILIGNHDAMNVYGDLWYVVDAEFAAFATPDSQRLLEKLFQAEVAWIQQNVPKEEWPEFDQTYQDNWLAERPLGFVEHRQSWKPSGDIGKWILEKNAVIKIGDTLFVHGGISPRFANASIATLNGSVRESLARLDLSEDSILQAIDSPLWYRGLALNEEDLEAEHVQTLLAHFGARRIVIGHTPTEGFIVPRFGNRVILADVGLATYYGANLACLEIIDGGAYAIHRGQRLELPDSSDPLAYSAYLDAIARLESGNKRILRGIVERKQRLFSPEAKSAASPAPPPP